MAIWRISGDLINKSFFEHFKEISITITEGVKINDKIKEKNSIQSLAMNRERMKTCLLLFEIGELVLRYALIWQKFPFYLVFNHRWPFLPAGLLFVVYMCVLTLLSAVYSLCYPRFLWFLEQKTSIKTP
jgi:hypothetical protein